MFYLLMFFASLLVMFFLFYISSGRDILSPPMIMVSCFILSTSCALINAKEWNIIFSFKSFVLLSTGILFFFLPYLFCNAITDKTECSKTVFRHLIVSEKRWVFIILIDLFVVMLFKHEIGRIITNFGYAGESISWAYRYITSVEKADSISTLTRVLIKIVDASSYVGIYVFINNALVSKEKMSSNIIYLVPSVIYAYKTILSGGRQDLLKVASFAVITSYILIRQADGWSKSISMKFIVLCALVLSIALPCFYYTAFLTGRSTSRSLFQVVSTYVGGSIQHFNQYVQNPIDKNQYWGNESFTPILNTLSSLGIIDYKNSVHLEFRKLGVTSGNIYTFFRRPLQDFGVVGMYCFTIMVSMFFSTYYVFFIKFHSCTMKKDFQIMMYSYLLYWIVLSSVEQYSMSIISIQTVLFLFVLYIIWKFSIRTEISIQETEFNLGVVDE